MPRKPWKIKVFSFFGRVSHDIQTVFQALAIDCRTLIKTRCLLKTTGFSFTFVLNYLYSSFLQVFLYTILTPFSVETYQLIWCFIDYSPSKKFRKERNMPFYAVLWAYKVGHLTPIPNFIYIHISLVYIQQRYCIMRVLVSQVQNHL